MRTHRSRPRRALRGMSLVEVMVAMVIGMIGCIIVFQVFSVSESRKRTISAGSDMDVSGRLGLMALIRDIQLAGYGYGPAAAITGSSARKLRREQVNLLAVGCIFVSVFVSVASLRLCYRDKTELSEKVDTIALVVLSVLYVVANVLVVKLQT